MDKNTEINKQSVVIFWPIEDNMDQPCIYLAITIWLSMTTLLTHTVAHSTKPSFRPKTNNQPLKKFLSLALS